MNSITKHLTAKSIAATLRTLRSAKKEIVLVVEGGDDIALFSALFGMSRSNFVDCRGKEQLMQLFSLIPHRGLDEGTIFIRDRDHDGIQSKENANVAIIVSDLYDIEMHLISTRLFSRIVAEYLRPNDLSTVSTEVFSKVVSAAAWIGALRLISTRDDLNLNFNGLSLSFIEKTTLEVDVTKLVRLVVSRSHADMSKLDLIESQIRSIVVDTIDMSTIASGKDMLAILQLAFHKHYRCCDTAAECSPTVLAKSLRVGCSLADLEQSAFYGLLKAKVSTNSFTWSGVAL